MNIKQLTSYLKKNDTVYFLLLFAILGYVVKYACNVVLAQYLSPALYGDFMVAIRLLTILYSVVLLGTNKASKRFLSHYLNIQDKEKVNHYIRWNIGLISISFSICLIIAILTFVVMHLLHFWHVKDVRSYHLTIYMLWVAPFAAMFSLLGGYLVGANHMVFHKFMQKTKYLSYMILVFIAVVLLDNQLDSYKLALIILFSFMLLAFLEILFMAKKTPIFFQSILMGLNVKKAKLKDQSWVVVSTFLGLSNLIYRLVCIADLVIIKIVQTNSDSVGFYAVALTIASSLLVIPSNICSSLKTNFHHVISSDEGKQILQKSFKNLNRISIIVTLLLCAIIFIYGETLLKHFGLIYIHAAMTLKILAIGFSIGTFAHSAATVLAYAGYEYILLSILVTELSLIVILGVTLTSFYGIEGMAIATAVSISLKTIALHLAIYRKLKINSMAW